MRYETTFNAKLAISRILVSLPRNALCQRTSRPHGQTGEESSESKEVADETVDAGGLRDKGGRALRGFI